MATPGTLRVVAFSATVLSKASCNRSVSTVVDMPVRLAIGKARYGGRGDCAELDQQAEVVPRRPVLRDQAVGDSEDMDVLHRVRPPRRRCRDQCRALHPNPTGRYGIWRSFRGGPE